MRKFRTVAEELVNCEDQLVSERRRNILLLEKIEELEIEKCALALMCSRLASRIGHHRAGNGRAQ